MRIAPAAFALLLSTAACGAEIEGVNLPDRVQFGAGSGLVLNGAGVRVRLIFKVYVAALYLPAKAEDGEAILRGDQPRRFVMHLLRDLSAAQINGSINDALSDTLTLEERKPLDSRMSRFNSILDNIREFKTGTQIVLDYVPRLGTTVRVNAEDKGHIPGADFMQALLRMWIGERPRDPDLRKALLGIGAR